MPNKLKLEFATQIGVSTTKLDSIMNDLGLKYLENPLDKRNKELSEAAQSKILEHIKDFQK